MSWLELILLATICPFLQGCLGVAVLKSHREESFDIVFLDAERPQYVSYWRQLKTVLKKGGLLIVDNALSPHPEELVDFFKLIDDSGEFLAQTLSIGKGEFIALKL